MKALWHDKVIAEANDNDIIRIEGNVYFPPESVNKQYLKESDHHTTCFWKGEASYYDVTADGETSDAAAWYYPKPMDGALERVKKDFTNYVAFWRDVEVIA